MNYLIEIPFGLNTLDIVLILITLLSLSMLTIMIVRDKKMIKRVLKVAKFRVEQMSREFNELKRKNMKAEMIAMVALNTECGVIVARPDGEIILVNKGYTRMTGYTLEKLKENNGGTIMENSNCPIIFNVINRAIKTGKSVSYETKTTSASGRKIKVSSLLTPVFDESGELQKFIIIDSNSSAQNKMHRVIENRRRLAVMVS